MWFVFLFKRMLIRMLIRMSIRMLINECKCKLHVIQISAPKPEERFLRLSFLVILKNTQFYNSYLNMFTSFSPITSFFFIKFLLIFSNEPYFFSHTISAQVLYSRQSQRQREMLVELLLKAYVYRWLKMNLKHQKTTAHVAGTHTQLYRINKTLETRGKS